MRSDHLFAGSVQKGALRAVPHVNGSASLQQRVNASHVVVAYLRMNSAFQRTEVWKEEVNRSSTRREHENKGNCCCEWKPGPRLTYVYLSITAGGPRAHQTMYAGVVITTGCICPTYSKIRTQHISTRCQPGSTLRHGFCPKSDRSTAHCFVFIYVLITFELLASAEQACDGSA